jgi:hypothetical protein
MGGAAWSNKVRGEPTLMLSQNCKNAQNFGGTNEDIEAAAVANPFVCSRYESLGATNEINSLAYRSPKRICCVRAVSAFAMRRTRVPTLPCVRRQQPLANGGDLFRCQGTPTAPVVFLALRHCNCFALALSDDRALELSDTAQDAQH